MTKYLGDIAEDATIRGSFNTRDTAGAPITLAGTPALAVYKDAGTTESTAGVTLTVDFDSRTGYHIYTIDTSADAFYATGSDYRIVLTAGTVSGTSVVGVEVGLFSIQNRFIRSEPPTSTAISSKIAEDVGDQLNGWAQATTVLSGVISGTIADNIIDEVNNWDQAVVVIQSGLATAVSIGTAGAGLTSIPWNAAWDAEVQSEVQDAIEANHLDHLFAVDYDPTAKPGVATALLNELIESDGGVSRYTANALEQAPSGGGGGGGSGNGEHRASISVIDADDDGVPNVQLKIVGSTFNTSATSMGDAYFDLDDDDYTLRVTPPVGYEAVDDIDFTVDGEDLTLDPIVLVRTVIEEPADPLMSRVQLRLIRLNNAPVHGAKVAVRLEGEPEFADTSYVFPLSVSGVTNRSGIVELDVPRASTFAVAAVYEFDITFQNKRSTFRVNAPTGATAVIDERIP